MEPVKGDEGVTQTREHKCTHLNENTHTHNTEN